MSPSFFISRFWVAATIGVRFEVFVARKTLRRGIADVPTCREH
jgi:hypothetical protein